MAEDRLTQAEVGAHLGLAQPRVGQVLAELGLTLEDGLERIRLAYIERLRGEVSGRQQRDALLHVRRLQAELSLRVRCGELIEAREAERAIWDLVRGFRNSLLALVDRIGPLLETAPAGQRGRLAQEAIERELREHSERLLAYAEQIAAEERVVRDA